MPARTRDQPTRSLPTRVSRQDLALPPNLVAIQHPLRWSRGQPMRTPNRTNADHPGTRMHPSSSRYADVLPSRLLSFMIRTANNTNYNSKYLLFIHFITGNRWCHIHFCGSASTALASTCLQKAEASRIDGPLSCSQPLRRGQSLAGNGPRCSVDTSLVNVRPRRVSPVTWIASSRCEALTKPAFSICIARK